MKRFFDLTFKPFFVLTGIGTAAAALYAFWPRWANETAGKVPSSRTTQSSPSTGASWWA